MQELKTSNPTVGGQYQFPSNLDILKDIETLQMKINHVKHNAKHNNQSFQPKAFIKAYK